MAKTVIVSSEERDVFFPASSGSPEESGSPAPDGSTGLKLTWEACFDTFDKDKDSALNTSEFSALLEALFRDEKGQPYTIDDSQAKEMFDAFSRNGTGLMTKEEFATCWCDWVVKILNPVSALIVVDVQNDFISGSLAISGCPAKHNGEDVVAPINQLTDDVTFDSYFYSLDWHPANHISFIENVSKRKLDPSSPVQDATGNSIGVGDTVVFEGPPKTELKLWPSHCVQDTWGSQLHQDLKVHSEGKMVHKGVNPEVDSYSAFFDNDRASKTALQDMLEARGVTDVYVCGIATDVCVSSTAFHAIELGYRTVFLEDCSRGIDEEGIKRVLDKIKADNGMVLDSPAVKAMVQARDRKPELGYFLALDYKKRME